MMMKRFLLFPVIILLIAFYSINAQSILTLQPDAASGKDNQVFSNLPNTNYVSDLLRGMAWTFQGDPGIVRALFQFDLSSLPIGSTIDSAFLSLYSPNAPTTEFHSGDNAAFLKRITSDWGETIVTWNNQPSTSSVHQISLPKSTADYQDYEHINVTELISDMFYDPANSFGFELVQQVEIPLRRMSFCSSDYPDNSKHPKLVIHYTPPACINVVLRQDGSGQDNQVFSLQPSSNYVSDLLRGMAWTFSGNPGIVRSLLEFDLSFIPPNADLIYAYLSLYSPDPPTTEFHSGSNSAYLQRITSDWSESTVTWNNQPSSTTFHQVILPVSTSEYQDYLNIDVLLLVRDMIANPESSHGFLLRQIIEENLRRLSFVSGDYPNAQKHPKLELCYNYAVSVDMKAEQNTKLYIYPNPTHDFVQIEKINDFIEAQLQIIDVFGRTILSKRIESSEEINISDFLPSVYIFRIISKNNKVLSTTKVIKL